MAYTDAPKIGEMLWSTQDNTLVYAEPKITAQRVLSNYTKDQDLHPFRKGDQVGTLLDDGVIQDSEGNRFYKIRAWEWKRRAVSVWTGNWDGYEDYQDFFDAYVRVDHEPEFWIRESRKDSYQQAQQKDVTDTDVAGYISGLRGVPQPTEIRKDSAGVVQLTFANGYQVSFDSLKKLSNDAIRTLTTEDPTKKVITTLTGNGSGNDSGNGSGNGSGSILTPQVLLIGLGSLLMIGLSLFIFLTLRKK